MIIAENENDKKWGFNFYKLEVDYNLPLKETIDFYGAEVGNDVLVLAIFNSDICTAMFTIKGSQLLKYGDNKYTIVEKFVLRARYGSKNIETGFGFNDLDELQDSAITGAIMDKSLEMAKKVEEDLKKPIPNTLESAKQEFNAALKEAVENPVVTAVPAHAPKNDKPAIIVKPVITKGKQEQKTEVVKTTPKPVNKPSILAEALTEARINKKEEKQKPPKKIKPDRFDPWSGSGW